MKIITKIAEMTPETRSGWSRLSLLFKSIDAELR